MSLFAELKRRNVLRVFIAYLAGAWLLIQIADVLWPIYGLSESSLQLLTNLLGIGLIPVLIISWVFEWTPQGLRRDADVAPGESIAPQTGKTLDRIMMIVLALAVGMLAFDKFVLDEDPLSMEERSSIVVLPFVNMSADPDQVYFSDGISEEILNLLAKIRQLRVISRSSAFMYRGDVHVPTVAEELNVFYVLEGSVRKAGQTVRITAQLIDARTDTHVWSETWDRDLTDIFAIQDEVATIVANRLELEFLGQALESRRTDPALYSMYLKVKHEMQTFQDSQRHIDTLKHVLEQDPEYLPAVNLLGFVYYIATGVAEHNLYPPEIGYPLQGAMIRRAIEIDPNDALVNAQLAWDYLDVQNDMIAAARAAEKAFRAEPGNAEVLRVVAALARSIEKFDSAIALGEMSVAKDPLCAFCYLMLGITYMHAGHYEEAERVFRKRMTLMPGGRVTFGESLLGQGRAQEALDAFYAQPGPDPAILASKANALFSLNRMDEFDEMLARFLVEAGEDFPMELAATYAWSGDADKAFYWLDRSAESGIRQLRGLQRYFLLESLREDPRWNAFWDEHWFTEEEFAAVELDIP